MFVIGERRVNSMEEGSIIACNMLKERGWVSIGIVDDVVHGDNSTFFGNPRKFAKWDTTLAGKCRTVEVPVCTFNLQIEKYKESANVFIASLQAGFPEMYKCIFADPRRVHKGTQVEGFLPVPNAVHFPTLIPIQIEGQASTTIPPPTSLELGLQRRAKTAAEQPFQYNFQLPSDLQFFKVSWSSHPMFDASSVPSCVTLVQFAPKQGQFDYHGITEKSILNLVEEDFDVAGWSHKLLIGTLSFNFEKGRRKRKKKATKFKFVTGTEFASSSRMQPNHESRLNTITISESERISCPNPKLDLIPKNQFPSTFQQKSSQSALESGTLSTISVAAMEIFGQDNSVPERLEKAKGNTSHHASDRIHVQKESVPILSDLSVKDLKEQLKVKRLKITGSKQELIARLKAAT